MRNKFLTAALAFLGSVAAYWTLLSSRPTAPQGAVALPVELSVSPGASSPAGEENAAVSTLTVVDPAAPVGASAIRAPFKLPPLPKREGLDPAFGKFDGWLSRYFAAGADERPALVAEGVALAVERRVALKALIPAAPEKALQNAVPMVVRQQMPAEVLSELEERISARGFYGVLAVAPEPGREPDPRPIRRQAVLDGGIRYEVYTFGQRLTQVTTPQSVMSGIAVDRVMALDEKRVRPLEIGEIPDATKPVESACPVSGKEVLAAAKAGALAAITEETPAVEVAGTVRYLCHGGHIVDLEQKVTAAEGGSGGGMKPLGAAGSWTMGPKTLLYIRVTFPDTLKEPQTEAAAYEMLRATNDFFIENSYGKLSLIPTVTPLLVLPKTEAYYTEGDKDGDLRDDALALAREMGYDVDSYDLDSVAWTGGPGGYGGQAWVGGKGVWIKSFSSRIEAHELGHNFGVWHSNLWDTSGRSVMGFGQNKEYGNVFDTMGSASPGDGHFCAQFKSRLGWLAPDQTMARVTRSGVYRIHAFDQPRLETGKRYALVIPKDGEREYWAEFRQKSHGGNLSIRDGIVLNFGPWGSGGAASAEGSNGGVHLLDTTPGSRDGSTDAPLVIGRTYSDWESNIHITPTGKGGTVPESMDVVVNLGPFPLNQPPTLSASASALSVAVGGTVSFSATASDPDGDSLAYAWYFSDQTFSSNNLPTASKTFATAGDYTVRCVVSDMKGGTATESLVVRVGNPQGFTVSGRVASGTLGIGNALISNGATGVNYREAWSQADGSYVLAGLSSGSYKLTAQAAGFTTTPGFTNPVTVTANVTGMQFSAAPITAVSIVAAEPVAVEGTAQKGRFVISRSGSATQALTVNLSPLRGTAAEGVDYAVPSVLTAAPTGKAVTIPSGSASVSVEVAAFSDREWEVEETVTLSVLPGASYEPGGNATATVRILDRENVVPVVRVETLTDSVREGSSAPAWRITRTTPLNRAIRVRLTVSGSATEGEDYTVLAREVEIPAFARSADVSLVTLTDGISEGGETVILGLQPGSGYEVVRGLGGTASVDIADADISRVRVEASTATTTEGAVNPGQFTLTRTGNLTRPVVVNFSLSGSALQGRDYEPVRNSVAFVAGQSSARVAIRAIPDGMGEPQQSVVLQIAASPEYDVDAQSSATVQIQDSGSIPVITVGALTLATAPSEPSSKGVFRFTAAGSGTGTVTVKYTVSGTATSGTDFTALPGVLTMNRNGTQDLDVLPLVDAVAEDWETVTVTLVPDPAYSLFLDKSATIRIADATNPAVSVSLGSHTKEGGAAGSFWISRTGATTAALVVNYSLGGTATNGTDYTALPGSVTIPVGKNGVAVTVNPTDDSLVEGTETVVLSITAGSYGVGVSSAMLRIEDNDVAPILVNFGAATGQGSEDVGVVNIPVQLSAASATPVSVEVYLGRRDWNYFRGGTVESAVLGLDYLVSPGVVTFAPGETTKNIPLTVLENSYAQRTRDVRLSLRYPTGASLGTQSNYDYSILDNDQPSAALVSFTQASSSGWESVAEPPIGLELSGVATAPVTVYYRASGGTAVAGRDYTLAGGSVSFAVGETQKSLPLNVLNNMVADGNRTLRLQIVSVEGGLMGSVLEHVYTIQDDEVAVSLAAAGAGVVVPAWRGGNGSFTVTGGPVAEGSNGGFTLRRTGDLTNPLTVGLQTSGSAVNGTDYSSVPSEVTFAAGASELVVSFTATNDTIQEGTETAVFSVLPRPGYLLGNPSFAAVSVLDKTEGNPPFITTVNDLVMAPNTVGQVSFRVGDLETPAASLTLSATSSNPGLIALSGIVFGGSLEDRSAAISPVANAVGESRICFRVTDASGGVAETEFLVSVRSEAGAPLVRIKGGDLKGGIIPVGQGVVLAAEVTDDGQPQAVSVLWEQLGGPVLAALGSPTNPVTRVKFSEPGSYAFRVTAWDGAFAASDEVRLTVGAAVEAESWGLVDLNPRVAARAQRFVLGGTSRLRAAGGGYADRGADEAAVMSRQVQGDVEIVGCVRGIWERESGFQGGAVSAGSAAFAGLTIRGQLESGAPRAALGWVPGVGVQFRTRSIAGASDAVSAVEGVNAPVWFKLRRELSSQQISAFYASDVNGAPGDWIPVGAAVSVAMREAVQVGATAASGSLEGAVVARVDGLTLSGAPSGPALVSEEPVRSSLAVGTGALSGGTYTLSGGSLGYFHGWTYSGDFVVTARQLGSTSSSFRARSGVRIAENLESGAFVHFGRNATASAYGFAWRSVAGGQWEGAPSFTEGTQWVRLVRRGTEVSAFQAPDVAGAPGTWIPVGSPQTVLMSPDVLVGFWVDNVGGEGLNTARFDSWSLLPLNTSPSIRIDPQEGLAPSATSLRAGLTDTVALVAKAARSRWSKVSGPGSVVFADPTALETSATFSVPGEYVLSLTAENGGLPTFQDSSWVVGPPIPVIRPDQSAAAVVGEAFSYQIVASDSPTSYGVRDLPPGLSLNASTGVISGIPSAPSLGIRLPVTATNISGVGSGLLYLNVFQRPAITSQPQGVETVEGGGFALGVTASGVPAPAYRWRKDGVEIPGATQSTYRVTDAQFVHSGNYDVLVRNEGGSVTSQSVVVGVFAPIQIVRHPVSQALNQGQPLVLRVETTGGGALRYQWRKDGVAISGANEPTYTVASLNSSHGGWYDVQIRMGSTVLTSQFAVVTINEPPLITQQPLSQSVDQGSPLVLRAVVTGTFPMTYQWRKNGVEIEGARSATLPLGPVTRSVQGSYDVLVTNAAGSVTSQAAQVQVNSALQILQQPVGLVLRPGSSGVLSVVATGKGILRYQWRRGGVAIEGANRPEYVLPRGAEQVSGMYDVQVSAMEDVVDSRAVMVKVLGFAEIQGRYQGLLEWKGAPAPGKASYPGRLTLTIARLGVFSGSLEHEGLRYSLRGRMGPNMEAQVSVRRGNRPALDLQLKMDMPGEFPECTVRLTEAGAVEGAYSEGNLARLVFDNLANLAPQAGRYTLLMEPSAPEAGQPEVPGYATVMVIRSGLVSMAGKWPDGVAFSILSFLSPDGRFACYAPLYASTYPNAGFMSGPMEIVMDPSDVTLQGRVEWTKPPQPRSDLWPTGFCTSFEARGGLWTAQVAANQRVWAQGKTGNFTLSVPWLSADWSRPFTVVSFSTQTLDAESDVPVDLTLDPGTGLIRGRYWDPISQKVFRWEGVAIENTDRAGGYILGTKSVGSWGATLNAAAAGSKAP